MFSPCFAARGASEQFVQTFVKKKKFSSDPVHLKGHDQVQKVSEKMT